MICSSEIPLVIWGGNRNLITKFSLGRANVCRLLLKSLVAILLWFGFLLACGKCIKKAFVIVNPAFSLRCGMSGVRSGW